MDTGRGGVGQDQSGGHGEGVQDPSTCCEERQSGTKQAYPHTPSGGHVRKGQENPLTPTPNISKEESLPYGHLAQYSFNLPVPLSPWCYALTWASALNFLANETAEQRS